MIFCVEDDQAIRDLMLYTLNVAGFKAKGFANADSLYQALREEKPELILLDIMLPGEDGLEILKKLKQNMQTCEIAVIMATAKGTEYDKVTGLDSGADDYLVKPFGMMEMLSRIKAVLRRSTPTSRKKVLHLGDLELNEAEHKVFSNGKRIILTLKEFNLLFLLMDNPGKVFTRDLLLQKIWGSDYMGETRTVDVHINTLRSKLEECGEYIETVRGLGYRMEARL